MVGVGLSPLKASELLATLIGAMLVSVALQDNSSFDCADANGNLEERGFGVSLWRSLSKLETWAESHHGALSLHVDLRPVSADWLYSRLADLSLNSSRRADAPLPLPASSSDLWRAQASDLEKLAAHARVG